MKIFKKFLMMLFLLSVGVTMLYAAEENKSKTFLKDAVLGAGVGAVAAGASGGEAGKGALVGAGTNLVGNMLFSAFEDNGSQQQQVQAQPQPQPQVVQVVREPVYYQEAEYYEPAPQPVSSSSKSNSRLQRAYDEGYQEGYRAGYRDGMRDAKSGF